MTRALDYFDPAVAFNDDLSLALETGDCGFLVISFSSDWRFSPARSREIIDALVASRRDVVGVNIQTHFGHDAFLLPVRRYLEVLRTYLSRVADEVASTL